MEFTPELMEWVERFGGWAVVFFVVRWMISRIDRQLDIMGSAVSEFSRFQISSEAATRELLKTQERIVALLDKMEHRLGELEHHHIERKFHQEQERKT